MISPDLESRLQTLKKAGRALTQVTSDQKNQVLLGIAEALESSQSSILKANAQDLDGLATDIPAAFRDRLLLNEKRIQQMATSLRQVAALADPVGEVVEARALINGLHVRRVRAPLGVLFMIFESRPNVILEAFSLAFKSGNRIVLRGGSESKHTSGVIYQLMSEMLHKEGMAAEPFIGILDFDRSVVSELLKRKDIFDVVIPRGGSALIEFVQNTSQIPIIKNDRGMCHAYVDEECELRMAVDVVMNGKTQRPGVCNALETVLVHEQMAATFLPAMNRATRHLNLQWRGDERTLAVINGPHIKPANEADWDTEYLDMILNCRVVTSFDEALAHIEKHGSGHSEAIITSSEVRARRFQAEVDAAAVYWNTSTRFTDGFMLGLGGELGISTQKLHVRGPVGLCELTTPRWVIDGRGQIRT